MIQFNANVQKYNSDNIYGLKKNKKKETTTRKQPKYKTNQFL
jgi:hypothetical protein